MDFPSQFRIICSALTIASTFYLLLAIYSYRSSSFVTYKFYLVAFILSNVLQALQCNMTTVMGNTWNNCYVMYAKGSVRGPAAIGIYLVMCSLTFVLLSFMFLFRYATVCSPSLRGHLSSRMVILELSLALSLSSLFFYSLPAFFFRPDPTSINLVVDFVQLVYNKRRDFAFELSIACYWERSLFSGANWLSITGLLGLYIALIFYFILLSTLTVLIISFLRNKSRISKSSRQLRHERGHLGALWFQFFLGFFFLIFNRVTWATLPLFSTMSNTSSMNRMFDVLCTFSLPLHPLISNITLILCIRELRQWLDRVIRRSNNRVNNPSLSNLSISNSALDR